MPERQLASGQPGGNIRMWFVPDEMTLQRNVDAQTGRATIVFDKATVALKTESFLQGLPQSPLALAFANHFNQYYEQFAGRDFPVMDPNDISRKIEYTSIMLFICILYLMTSCSRFQNVNPLKVRFL